MDIGKPTLDNFAFEVRYAFGQTYLDRCGQTMADIERAGTGWVSGEANPNQGLMENHALAATMIFDTDRFVFAASKVPDLRVLAVACSEVWDVVRSNLNVSEYVRVASRFQWMMACTALDQAESILRKLPLNVRLPESLNQFERRRQSVVVVLRAEDQSEYRVSLQSITRMQGLPVSAFTSIEPRMLPKHRRNAQLEMLKRRAEYDANPLHAVLLDVDCVTFAPERIAPTEFLVKQDKVIRGSFLPLLRVT